MDDGWELVPNGVGAPTAAMLPAESMVNVDRVLPPVSPTNTNLALLDFPATSGGSIATGAGWVPLANGDPETAVSAPLVESSENTETLFVPWLATITNFPSGVTRIPCGLLPPLGTTCGVPTVPVRGSRVNPTISPPEVPSHVTPSQDPEGAAARPWGTQGSAIDGVFCVREALRLLMVNWNSWAALPKT